MSIKIDKKDKRLLYELDLNARQKNSQIAKKVGLSKDAVGYRIKQLEKKRIIRGYRTIIDSTKLGYTLYRTFFKLIDMMDKTELIEFLQKEKNVWWIAKLEGEWDFAFATWTKTNQEFKEIYKKLCERFKPNIKEKLICPITTYKTLNRSYLLEEKTKKTEIIGGGEKKEYDKKDLEILKIIAKNARTTLIEIGQKLKLDSMTIYYRIKKLEKKGIIQGYKADIDTNTLKREFYSIKINLKNMNKIKEIENKIKNLPEVTATTEAIGSYDIEFDIEVKNTEEYYKILTKIKNETIREIKYFKVRKNYKILYLPE